MRKRIRIITTVLLCSLVSSCQQEENNTATSLNEPVRFFNEVVASGSGTTTRAAMEAGFEVNDKVGIYMVSREDPGTAVDFKASSDKWTDNTRLTLAENKEWDIASPVYWKSQTDVMDVIGYYPFIQESASLTNVNKVVFSVQKDQHETADLRKSDFLFARQDKVSATNNAQGILLKFEHVLCKMTVKLTFPQEVKEQASEIIVTIHNAKTSGTVNLNDGTPSTNESLYQDITLHYDTDTQLAEAVLFPQTFSAGTLLVTVSFPKDDLVGYTYTLESPLSLVSGKNYQIEMDCNQAD